MGPLSSPWRANSVLHHPRHPEVKVTQTQPCAHADMAGLFLEDQEDQDTSAKPVLPHWRQQYQSKWWVWGRRTARRATRGRKSVLKQRHLRRLGNQSEQPDAGSLDPRHDEDVHWLQCASAVQGAPAAAADCWIEERNIHQDVFEWWSLKQGGIWIWSWVSSHKVRKYYTVHYVIGYYLLE